MTELSKRELALQAQLDSEHRCQSDLKADIETQEGVIKHFQEIVQEYKTERHKLKSELAHVTDTLRKRNESIGLIETEVVKVKEFFKKREAQLLCEKDEALKRMEMEHLDRRLSLEVRDFLRTSFNRDSW